ncbi:hypothetical protein [Coleofasciculus sp. FACHB-T130]|uniref:hypothetical protein n=1 Tax=Cyanophyceae TaxID=3028117 RepID=UPI0016845247|nr:hypothetical protein [Coleofasciculus sp. FACHB-T130]MBD1879081.1 hypothetical protein [Coleofasciculus sp. FACHB-T130]
MNDALLIPGAILLVLGGISYHTLSGSSPKPEDILIHQQITIQQQQQRIQQLEAEQRGMLMNR